MKRMIQRCASAMMAALMTAGAGSMLPAGAVETVTMPEHIVVLGDSIVLGSTPDGSTIPSYVELLQEHTKAQMDVYAAPDNTTADVLALLDEQEVQASLADADLIIVSAGMHDILDPFLVKADEMKNAFGFSHFFDAFSAQLSDYGISDPNELLPYSNELTKAARSNMQTCGANIKTIGERLDTYGGDGTQIIYLKGYNMMDNLPFYDDLSDNRQLAYDKIRNPIGVIISEFVNEPIDAITAARDFDSSVDTYTFFAGQSESYTYLSDLNMNPNAAGERYLFEETLSTAGLLLRGDANLDGKPNSTDASLMLVHAARIGARQPGILTPTVQRYVDVIRDDAVNAKDASRVLIYAAQAGAKLDPNWD